MKAKVFFNVVLDVNYYDLTLDDKLEICRKYKGKWEGASYEYGKTTILLSK